MEKNNTIPFGKRGDKLITIDDLDENEYQKTAIVLVLPDCV